MSTLTPNLGLFKYDVTNDSQTAFSITNALNNNWDKIDENWTKGSSRNIGEIVTSTIPLVDAGLHLLDGALINGSGIYSDFVTYIAGLRTNYPDLFVTSAVWQNRVSTYGVCGKFVYDSTNNTVRLPKITGIIEGTTDLTALGDLVEAGLPNITGGMSASGTQPWQNSSTTATGAFKKTTTTTPNTAQSSASGYAGAGFIFDASRSNSVYGNSTTVQPQTIKVLYYIVIATSTKTDIQVDIDEIATDLNGKVDKSNLQEVQCIVETYQSGTSWYRVYSDGWCEQGGYTTTNGTYAISLLKTMKDTNYSIGLVESSNGNSNPAGSQNSIPIKGYCTINSIYVYINTSSGLGAYWEVKGYIEV